MFKPGTGLAPSAGLFRLYMYVIVVGNVISVDNAVNDDCKTLYSLHVSARAAHRLLLTPSVGRSAFTAPKRILSTTICRIINAYAKRKGGDQRHA